jgi:hypothetical protein
MMSDSLVCSFLTLLCYAMVWSRRHVIIVYTFNCLIILHMFINTQLLGLMDYVYRVFEDVGLLLKIWKCRIVCLLRICSIHLNRVTAMYFHSKNYFISFILMVFSIVLLFSTPTICSLVYFLTASRRNSSGLLCSSLAVGDRSSAIAVVDTGGRPPCALLLEPPWSSDQELRGVRAALPQPSWRPRLIAAAAALHRGASCIGCYVLSFYFLLCSLSALLLYITPRSHDQSRCLKTGYRYSRV